jgi:hypothetical protein
VERGLPLLLHVATLLGFWCGSCETCVLLRVGSPVKGERSLLEALSRHVDVGAGRVGDAGTDRAASSGTRSSTRGVRDPMRVDCPRLDPVPIGFGQFRSGVASVDPVPAP